MFSYFGDILETSCFQLYHEFLSPDCKSHPNSLIFSALLQYNCRRFGNRQYYLPYEDLRLIASPEPPYEDPRLTGQTTGLRGFHTKIFFNEKEISLIEEAEEEDDLWNGHILPNLYSDELNTEEMFNPINPFVDRYDGREGLKRKARMAEADHNKSKFSSVEKGESSGARSRSEQVEMLLPPLCLLGLSLVSPGVAVNFTDLGCRPRLLHKHMRK
ncbi:hypothetical protein YC2023_099807 [Brassica napus]